jgi:methyl-accepting chemotaxis protein
LIGLQLDVAAQEYQLSARIDQRARVISLSTIVFGVTAAILVGWWLIGSVTRSLEEAVRVAGRIARGDLTQRVHPRSSREAAHLLRSLREMNGHLADIVSTVRESTQMVTCATSTVSTGRLDQSTCAKPHATSLEPRAAHAVRGRGWLGPDLG